MNDEKTPIEYLRFHYNDNIFDISKSFIICCANLKLTKYYFSQKNYDESKYYFQNFFMSIMSDKYPFNILFSYLKKYILNSPLFGLIDNQMLSFKNKNIKENNTQFNLISNNLNEKQKSKEKYTQGSFNSISSNIDDEINFKNPSQLFDFIKNKPQLNELFIKEIQNILTIMENELYKYPYAILFGRIIIPNSTKKEKVVNNIDEKFYDGLDINEFKYKNS